MMETHSFIGDKGVIKKTDTFGIVVISVCSAISVGLIILGLLAIIGV